MAVGAMHRLDGVLDLIVGEPLLLQVGRQARLGEADAAAGGVGVHEAGQQGLVPEHRTLGALAEAVQAVQRGGILARDLVALLDLGLVSLRELRGVERLAALLAGRTGVRGLRSRLRFGSRSEQRQQENQEQGRSHRFRAHAPSTAPRVLLFPTWNLKPGTGKARYLRLSMISSSAFGPGSRCASGTFTIGSPVTPESDRKSFFAGST